MYSFSLRDKIMLLAMCVMMVVVQFVSSCTSAVTEIFMGKPETQIVEKPEPIVIEEPKVEPQPKPDPKPEPKPSGKIVMYTSDGCAWCIRWEQNELQKVKDAGWNVDVIKTSTGPWPRFDVSANGKTIKHTGYMNMAALRGIVERLK